MIRRNSTKYNLSESSDNYADALHMRLPDMNKSEIEDVASVLLGHITQHIRVGDQIAFIRENGDGASSLFTLSIDEDE